MTTMNTTTTTNNNTTNNGTGSTIGSLFHPESDDLVGIMAAYSVLLICTLFFVVVWVCSYPRIYPGTQRTHTRVAFNEDYTTTAIV